MRYINRHYLSISENFCSTVYCFTLHFTLHLTLHYI